MTLFKFRGQEFHSPWYSWPWLGDLGASAADERQSSTDRQFSLKPLTIRGVTQSVSRPKAVQLVLFSRSDYCTSLQSTQIRYPWKNVSLIYRLILLIHVEWVWFNKRGLDHTTCRCGLQCHSCFSGISVWGSWVRKDVLAPLCVSGWCCRRRRLSPGAVGLLWA